MTQQPGPGAPLPPTGPYPGPPAVAPPPADGRWEPARIEPVAGTEYGLVQLRVHPISSGLATGSLIAGIASVLVSVLVLCFGVIAAQESWGGWVAGAFTLLAVLAGGGAVTLGLLARRQIRDSGREGRIRFTGRGTALAGVSCGLAGAGIALLCLVLGLVLRFA